MDKLFVGVLGHRDSGKSTTWNTLFNSTVRTGQYARQLSLFAGECADVFLISGSPEERGIYANDILRGQNCQIVLCSIQYIEGARETLNFATIEGFDIYIQWLNPGRNDAGENFDRLGLVPWLLGHDATVTVRDGTVSPAHRVEEIRQFIYGWAKARGLTHSC